MPFPFGERLNILSRLVDLNGNDVVLKPNATGEDLTTQVLSLTNAEQSLTFDNIPNEPVPSLLRHFSAPVNLQYDYSDDQLAHLMAHDSDPFNRWEAGQRLALNVLLRGIQAHRADDDVDMFVKGYIQRKLPEAQRRISDKELVWLDKLNDQGRLEKRFNTTFLSAGDSREPELSGVWGAAVGSFFTLLVTVILAFPIGVAGAIYLEEFAPKNRLTDLIEVNINNLAAVPSIVFGLLGLAVFLNFLGMPRSAPLVGGVVLALMTLPTIIIAARAALKSVPQSIREAAVGLGASRNQVVFHHILPLAMPGVLTGTIIGMARALGETAPLLMIGMVAFIVDIPGGFTDPATALPVQIYLWADSPERAFVERTSAAVMVLLGFLIIMNLAAALLRKKFERQW